MLIWYLYNKMGMAMKDQDQTNTCYCWQMRRATGSLTRFYDELLAPSGVTISQYGLMANISKASKGSLSELATMAKLDRSTLVRNIRVLVKKGLVHDSSAPETRDCSYVLSQAGIATLAKAEVLWNQAQGRVVAALGPDEVAKLEEMLAILESL